MEMNSVTVSDFRLNLSAYINVAKQEPVMITTDSSEVRAALVSPEFYERAIRALEDQAERTAGTAEDDSPIQIGDLFDELGI